MVFFFKKEGLFKTDVVYSFKDNKGGMGMGIEGKDIINFEMGIVFYYKDCEVTLKKINQIYIIKIIGISNFGNLLSASRAFNKEVNRQTVIDYLENEIGNIERVYKDVLNKEFGMDDSID